MAFEPAFIFTGFTIGGTAPCVAEASLEVSRSALRAIDLRAHKASHPRVGVVDHVSIHPVGNTAEAKASACETGRTIAETLGREGLPVLLYGDLKDDRRLAEVRCVRYTIGVPTDLPCTRGRLVLACCVHKLVILPRPYREFTAVQHSSRHAVYL